MISDVDRGSLRSGTLRIVGLASSAAGPECFLSFFRGIEQPSGMAFVVLSKALENGMDMLHRLAAARLPLPVSLVTNGVQVQADNIYVVPHDKGVILSDGRLLFVETCEGTKKRSGVDVFFRSLAAECGSNAVGVIMSNDGGDGARGAQDIREAGGTAIVHPEPWGGSRTMMPGLGLGDVSGSPIPPSQIARSLGRPSAVSGTRPASVPSNPIGGSTRRQLSPGIQEVFHLLHGVGMDASHYKTERLEQRIEQRMKSTKTNNLSEFVEVLKRDSNELDLLYRVLVGETTNFLSDTQISTRLRQNVLPELLDGHREDEFRCWVVGAGIGEEAYLIAMIATELFEELGLNKRIHILASDIDDESLAFARRGVFPADRLTGLATSLRARFFLEREDGFHVVPDVKETIVFSRHNVVNNVPFSRLDLVSCQNLLTDLAPESENRAMSRLHFALKTDGVLWLGENETLGTLRDAFEPIDDAIPVYRKREMLFSDSGFTAPTSRAWSSTWAVRGHGERPSTRALLRMYDRILSRTTQSAILVGPNREILHLFGNARRFLSHDDRPMSVDALNVIHQSLRSPLSSALRQLQDEKTSIRIEGIECIVDGKATTVTMALESVCDGHDSHPRVLIRITTSSLPDETIRPDRSPVSGDALLKGFEPTSNMSRHPRVDKIQELTTTIQNAQSDNHYLNASNEALQCTNEELHSMNEQLHAVNADYQRRIDELMKINDDIDNLLTTTNVHTLILDSDMRLRRFTPRIAELFHLVPRDIGRHIDAFAHSLLIQNLTESIRDVVDSETMLEQEVEDSRGQSYLLRICPYLSDGNVEGAVVTLVDISSLQAATSALQRSEERFDLAARGCNAGIWDWKDVNQESIWCSDRVYSLLGFERAEFSMTISLWKDMIHPADADRVVSALEDHLVRGGPFDVECRIERAGGDYRWFHVRGAVNCAPGTDIRRMAGSLEDVTDRRLAEEAVRNAILRRDQFLAMLSHELRNPLAAVNNATALMASDGVDKAASDRALAIVHRQVLKMSRLLDDLLDVSRITHGKIELRRRHVDLRVTVQESMAAVQNQSERAELKLALSNALPDAAVTVFGDPERLEQVLVNLLTNAIKYTPPGGSVRLTLTSDQENARIEVADTGVGVPKDKMHEIFELFYQSDATLDRSDGGMGVGLTLVQSVVELHGGSVSVASDGLGAGSRFTVSLPLANGQPLANAQDKEASDEVPQAHRIRRVVLVEDMDDAREMLAAVLRRRGLEVIESRDGRHGLESIRTWRPDVALIDIGLPGLNGHEVATAIRADERLDQVKLVALTGYGQAIDRQEAKESGFDLHILKPFNLSTLDAVLAKLSDSSHPDSAGERSAKRDDVRTDPKKSERTRADWNVDATKTQPL